MITRSLLLVESTVVTIEAFEANGPFIESYLTDRATVWGKLTAIFTYSTAWKYCKISENQRNGRKGYLPMYYHHIGQNNVDHLASTAEKIRQNAVYHRKQKNNTF